MFGGGWSRVRVPGDSQRYYESTFVDKHGNGQLAITCQQDIMGMTAASVLATKAAMLFRPRYLIMCGIAAGICKDADQMYGDVLVPSTVWDYSTGKVVGPDESELHFGAVGFLPRPNPMYLDSELKKLMQELKKPNACEFHLHTGPLACGPSVMANEFAVDFQVRALCRVGHGVLRSLPRRIQRTRAKAKCTGGKERVRLRKRREGRPVPSLCRLYRQQVRGGPSLQPPRLRRLTRGTLIPGISVPPV